jgi:hypothetical protein
VPVRARCYPLNVDDVRFFLCARRASYQNPEFTHWENVLISSSFQKAFRVRAWFTADWVGWGASQLKFTFLEFNTFVFLLNSVQ